MKINDTYNCGEAVKCVRPVAGQWQTSTVFYYLISIYFYVSITDKYLLRYTGLENREVRDYVAIDSDRWISLTFQL